MKTNFALGIEVYPPDPTGRKPFCEERAKRLQRKARPAGKRPKMVRNSSKLDKTRWISGEDNILMKHSVDIK